MKLTVTSAVGCEFSTTVKCACPPASVVLPGDRADVDARRVVVDVGDRHVRRQQPVVQRVAARRRGEHDRVRLRAVGDVVVLTGERDGLRTAFQFAGVNVSAVDVAVPSVVSLLVKCNVTLPVGCELSTTVNVACPPASRGVAGDQADRDAGRVVVDVGDGDARRRELS